jgi:hypothetical protein
MAVRIRPPAALTLAACLIWAVPGASAASFPPSPLSPGSIAETKGVEALVELAQSSPHAVSRCRWETRRVRDVRGRWVTKRVRICRN